MYKLYYAVAVTLLFATSACRLSETKDGLPKQTVDLFVRYLQPEQEYKAEAILLEGDSLPLAKSVRFPAGISFLDKDLTELEVSENLLRYSTDFGGPFANQAAFTFQDKLGTQQSISLNMEVLGEIELAMPTKLEGQVELNIASGGALKQGESLVLVLTDRSGQTSTVTIEGPSTSGSYSFPLVSFGNPVKGNAEVYVVKKQVRDEQKGKLQIHLTEELYSASLQVKIP